MGVVLVVVLGLETNSSRKIADEEEKEDDTRAFLEYHALRSIFSLCTFRISSKSSSRAIPRKAYGSTLAVGHIR